MGATERMERYIREDAAATSGEHHAQPAQTGDGELAEWRRIANEGSSAGGCSGADLRALIARLDADESAVATLTARLAAAEALIRSARDPHANGCPIRRFSQPGGAPCTCGVATYRKTTGSQQEAK